MGLRSLVLTWASKGPPYSGAQVLLLTLPEWMIIDFGFNVCLLFLLQL